MFKENLKVTPEEANLEFLIEYEGRFKEMVSGFIPEADNLDKLLNDLGNHLSREFLKRFNGK